MQEELGRLATTDRANLWVDLDENPEIPSLLRVTVYPYFEAEIYMLTVYVDGVEYCNLGSLEIEEANLMGCSSVSRSHSSVRDVSADVYLPDRYDRLVCALHTVSTADWSTFACAWEGESME